ncbi:MAG: hypothetical protein HY828_09455 [Actinobacteria bacterium]|nr:hypothetical protein [Actinomycetota bacterium]
MSPSLVAVQPGHVPDGVELDVRPAPNGVHVVLTAARSLGDGDRLATGRFAAPSAWAGLVVHSDGAPEYLGFAFTQFALPVVAGPSLDFDFHPAHNLHSPSAVGVLVVRAGDRTALVAPISNPHEQIIAVHAGALRWGWHGDLQEVAAGFSTVLGVYEGASAAEVFEQWSADLGGGTPLAMRSRDRNPVTSHLSYWTDNGAAYWYRTEPGLTIGESVAHAVTQLRGTGVPVHAVELDSWCYPHEVLRPIAEIGYPEEVPPTGMMRWEPRPDAFPSAGAPADPIEAWSAGVGHPPLVVHSRHIGPASTYLAEGEWFVDDLAAFPVDPAFFRRWFDDAVRWGVCCIEQDWMLMYWFGVRALRAVAGRAQQWQRALDQHAHDTGVGLMWCMATPADLVLAASLPGVVAVRTSDDYRFAADPAQLWIWYLTVNRLAGALGLPAFKDVFFSQVPEPDADPIDGDPHAEFEALLSALSAGVVGIGDRIGHTDAEVVLRTCDGDGRLRHVDAPVALVDDCLFGAPARGERLAWATATATTDRGRWTYVLAVNASMPGVNITDSYVIDDVADVLDWRTGSSGSASALTASLAPRDWSFWVIAPPGASAREGDLTKYVTVPSNRT